MSVVVVGGNDRMATGYKDICRSFNCKAKVFTQMPSDFENKLGTLNNINIKLDGFNPRKLAHMGYSKVIQEGKVVSKVAELNNGDITLSMIDGNINCKINR